MKYFKNTELAKLYNVSEKAVRNWIDATKQGKLELQLYEHNGRAYIANVSKNTLLIEQLVEKGKKYKNKRSHKVIFPTQKFYETYNQKQILDIISNLTVHHELPLQYNYVEDEGADYWDKYTSRLYNEESPNMLTGTMQLLNLNIGSIDHLVASQESVNVIDLGPGNGMAARKLLEHLHGLGKLRRYIAIDISQEMLNIAEAHVKEWFGGKVAFEGHVRDFSHERFDDLLAQDYVSGVETPPMNLVLLVGGTLCNFRSQDQALQAINNSLGPNDLLVYGTKLDTPNSRRYFDFGVDSKPRPLDYLFKVLVDLLNIKESLYEVDQFYDPEKRARFIGIRPTVDLSIEFNLGKGTRYVDLNKNERLLIWRYWHQSAVDVIEQFDRNGFTLMHAAKSLDQEYIVLVSRIKVGEQAD